MRYRCKVDETKTGNYIPHNWTGGLSAPPTATTSYMAEKKHIAMYDEVVEDFLTRRSAGEVFMNPMERFSLGFKQSPLVVRAVGYDRYPWVPITRYFRMLGPPLSTPSFGAIVNSENWVSMMTSEADIAVTAAYANVDESKMNLLASLGELPETIKYLVQIMQRVNNTLRAFKRRNLTKLKDQVKSIFTLEEGSNLWLEARYAIRPLIYDYYAVLESLNTKLLKQRMTSRGWRVNKTDKIELFDYQWYTEFSVRTRFKHTESTKARAGVLYDIAEDINEMLTTWGLNMPFQAMWELVPFSFILDWFFNTGEVIAAWAPQPGLRQLGSWVTVTQKNEFLFEGIEKVINIANTPWIGALYLDTAPTYSLKWDRKFRIPNPKRPILPDFKLRLDAFKLADLAFIGRNICR